MTFYTEIESPVGPLLLAASEEGLKEIQFGNGRHGAHPKEDWKENEKPLRETIRQLRA